MALLAILFATGIGISGTRAEQREHVARQDSGIVAAAKEALAAVQESYDAGRASAEDIYLWSRRVAEAARLESPKGAGVEAAAAEHIERMKELHSRVAKMHGVGLAGGELRVLKATRYYVAAAERELELLKSGLL